MLGEIGDGFKVAMSALDAGRYSVAAGCVGICDGCVDASVAYSTERKQFGVPLARFQLVQEMIAEMIVKRDAARMLVWRAADLKDRGLPNTTETSVAKYYATESAVECANLAIQVHGGSGYVDDYPVERYLRDARVTTLYEGTSQIQKLIIGRAATGINAMLPMSQRMRASRRRFRRDLDRRPCRAAAVEPPGGSQCALAGDDGRDRRIARAPRSGPRDPLRGDRRQRRGLRRGRRHQGDERAHLPRGPLPPRGCLLEAARRGEDADDRRGLGVGAGWRLRAGAGLRPDRRLGDRRVRAARDHPGDHPRRRRHAAPRPRPRQAAGDGAGADRQALRRPGG